MNDKAISAFISRLYRSNIYCDNKSAQATLDALMSAYHRNLAHINSGKNIAARQEWLNVRMLAFEVYNLELGGVIEIDEGGA